MYADKSKGMQGQSAQKRDYLTAYCLQVRDLAYPDIRGPGHFVSRSPYTASSLAVQYRTGGWKSRPGLQIIIHCFIRLRLPQRPVNLACDSWAYGSVIELPKGTSGFRCSSHKWILYTRTTHCRLQCRRSHV